MIKRNIVSFFLAILIAFMFLACSSSGGGGGDNSTEPVSEWSTEVVTDGGPSRSGIAVDSDGKVHISSCFDNSLIYAGGRSKDWQITVPDKNSQAYSLDFCYGNDISVGPDKLPQISYRAGSTEVRLARLIGTNWNITTVGTGGYLDSHIAIAVDIYNRPHVVYAADDEFLKYAVLDGSTWTRENVAKLDNYQMHNADIAVDGLGRPHISYQGDSYPNDYVNRSVKYATRTEGGWQTMTVDADGDNYNPSIAVDTAGTPHLSYTEHNLNADMRALKYAVRKGSGWEITTAAVDESVHNSFSYSSIAVDSAGHVHISYVNNSDQSLNYAYNNGTSWSTETVDPHGLSVGVQWQTKIAVDGQNRPHISYYDSWYKDKTMYAHKK